jgi:hypothetical protein
MLPEVHGALRQMLYERGQISPLEVDISFETPTREWIDRLTRPTINLFLCNVKENPQLRQRSFEVTRSGDGRAERRRTPNRIDLEYMVTALATDVDDGHRLLWRTLATLMTYPEIPAELLPGDLDLSDTPVKGRMAEPEDRPNLLDIWSGLGAVPRPSLVYVLTVPLDTVLGIQAPLVLTRAVRFANLLDPDGAKETATQIAGVVRGSEGEPLAGVRVEIEGRAREGSITDDHGQFALSKMPLGEVSLRLVQPDGSAKTVKIEIPSESYDVVLE